MPVSGKPLSRKQANLLKAWQNKKEYLNEKIIEI